MIDYYSCCVPNVMDEIKELVSYAFFVIKIYILIWFIIGILYCIYYIWKKGKNDGYW